jgi:hypothetical protein
MANDKTISRQDIKRQQNSVLPTTSKHPFTLNNNPTSGFQTLNETAKLLSQVPISRVVENATVLENWPPVGELKTRYTLPHLNLKIGEVLEDYLLKIRDPIHDEGSKINPEDLMIELKNLDKNSSSFFKDKPKSFDEINIIKQYYDCVATHSTFAPLYTNGTTCAPPLPGTKVRIHYFQEPHISSGHKISGYYEKMYDNDIFEEGFEELKNLLKSFRERFLKAASELETIAQQTTANIAALLAQIVSGSSAGPFAEPIAGVPSKIRDYIASKTETEKYDYFSAFIPLNGGTFRAGANQKNIVGLRLSTNTRINRGMGAYDDVFYLIWKDASGNKRVDQYTGNTEPIGLYMDPVEQRKVDLNMPHLGRLKPGYMRYRTYVSPKRGRVLGMQFGTSGLFERDTNDDGLFNDGNESRGDPGMLFHSGGKTSPYSAGCQTMPPTEWNRFINTVHSGGDPKELGYTLVDESNLKDPDEGKWDSSNPTSQVKTVEEETSFEQNPDETSSEQELSS